MGTSIAKQGLRSFAAISDFVLSGWELIPLKKTFLPA